HIPRPPISTPFPYTTLFRSKQDFLEVDPQLRAARRRCGHGRQDLRDAMFRGGAQLESMVRDEMKQPQQHFRVLHRVRLSTTTERSEEHTSELQSQSNLVCRL